MRRERRTDGTSKTSILSENTVTFTVRGTVRHVFSTVDGLGFTVGFYRTVSWVGCSIFVARVLRD